MERWGTSLVAVGQAKCGSGTQEITVVSAAVAKLDGAVHIHIGCIARIAASQSDVSRGTQFSDGGVEYV
jgi:hypothetical protein